MIKKVIRFKQVLSTQDTAKRFVEKKEEIAVAALRQKKGRGRHGRSWFSPTGGLYLSLLLFPEKRLTSIPLLAALVIIKALEDFGFSKLSVHWPNDVLLNNRKVCGIICEKFRSAIVCGIGLNINIERFSQNLNNATSLRIESGRNFDIDEILDCIICKFNPLYEELQNEGIKIEEILNYISGIGEPVEIYAPEGVIKGTVYDIDDDWTLLLRDEVGMVRKFYYGDVRRLKW
jgi:BirA family biotin operon repressor/biotin-[acetyl-CoA-carboxylase] ligase